MMMGQKKKEEKKTYLCFVNNAIIYFFNLDLIS